MDRLQFSSSASQPSCSFFELPSSLRPNTRSRTRSIRTIPLLTGSPFAPPPTQAQHFKHTAHKVARSYWWKNVKLVVVLVVIVLVIILIIVLLATGVIPVSNPPPPMINPTVKPNEPWIHSELTQWWSIPVAHCNVQTIKLLSNEDIFNTLVSSFFFNFSRSVTIMW